MPRDGANRRLSDPLLEQWVPHSSKASRLEPRPEIVYVVRVGAGQQHGAGGALNGEQLGEGRVQLRLAVEAPHGVVAGVGVALDLVGLHRPVPHPEQGCDVPGRFELSCRQAGRDGRHGGHR
jgi:hypothetical protein